MSDTLAPSTRKAASRWPNALLKASAITWFCIALVGQWIFVAFIILFFGPSTFTGQFVLWDQKNNIHGFIEGDLAGNLMFAVHVLLAAVITFGGTLQLIPQLRARFPALHRWTGRVFMVVAIIMAVGGLWLVWVRGTYLSIETAIAISLNGILILIFAGTAWRLAMQRRIALHHHWALRTFMVVSGVWFLRVMIMAWVLIAGGPVGMTREMNGPADLVFVFGCYLIPLAFLELYLWAQRSEAPVAKVSVALIVFILTGLMGLGIFGAYLGMWGPHM